MRAWLRSLLRREPPHQHEYDWRWSPEGAAWFGGWFCGCGHSPWQATFRGREDLNATLAAAFRDGRIDSLGYFAAPTDVPASPGVFQWAAQVWPVTR